MKDGISAVMGLHTKGVDPCLPAFYVCGCKKDLHSRARVARHQKFDQSFLGCSCIVELSYCCGSVVHKVTSAQLRCSCRLNGNACNRLSGLRDFTMHVFWLII